MKIGPWQFTPGLIPTVATLVVFPVLISLGLWQLDRAEQKRTAYQEFLGHQQETRIHMNKMPTMINNTKQMLWRHVDLEGRFIIGNDIFLDNQVMNGRVGYLVFTPFVLEEINRMVLVNRGWVEGSGDRNRVPVIKTPASTITISAIVTDVPVTGIELGNSSMESMENNSYRVQKIDIKEIGQLIKNDLLPYVVRLEPDSGYGFERKWQPPGSGEDKHLGYAFQWFALAATLVIIYIVVNTRRITS